VTLPNISKLTIKVEIDNIQLIAPQQQYGS